jgi:hypothetical protein
MVVQISGGKKRCTGAGVQGCSVYGCRCAKILYAGAQLCKDTVWRSTGVQGCLIQGAQKCKDDVCMGAGV